MSSSNSPITRPVLRWHGGKFRLRDWVIKHFPPHGVYVELFGGVYSVGLAKRPARIEVYNDLDECVVNLFRILRDREQSEQLRRQIELTPFSRAEFADCWTRSTDPIEDARRLIVRSFQAIGAKGSLSRNGWRTRTSKAIWSPCVSWNGWPEEIPLFMARLKDTIIECKPWPEILDIYDAPDALIYADPPYIHSTRDDDHKNVYEHEMTDAEHAFLLYRLRRAKGMVALSGYAHPMYDEALVGWHRFETAARAQTNAPRVEVLWLNPAAGARLQTSLFDSQHILGATA